MKKLVNILMWPYDGRGYAWGYKHGYRFGRWLFRIEGGDMDYNK